jgi:hypothetical protein
MKMKCTNPYTQQITEELVVEGKPGKWYDYYGDK